METEYKAKSDELMKSGGSDSTPLNNNNHNNNNVVYLKINLRTLSNITLFLPLSGLFFCFVTGYIFQGEEIHETHCRVSYPEKYSIMLVKRTNKNLFELVFFLLIKLTFLCCHQEK